MVKKVSAKAVKANVRPLVKPSLLEFNKAEKNAREISALVKTHGANVMLTNCANQPDDRHDDSPLTIILNALIKAGDRNCFAGEMVYGRCLPILLEGLKAKACQKRAMRSGNRDVELLARFAYDLTKFVQEKLPRRLVAGVARHKGEFPIMMCLNKRNSTDNETYLREIKCGEGLPWSTGKDSKWTSKGKQGDATEIAQELINEVGIWLRDRTGRNVAFTKKNSPRYRKFVEKYYLTREFLDDPLLDRLVPATSHHKTEAARRGRLKNLIWSRMESMLKKEARKSKGRSTAWARKMHSKSGES